MHQAGPVPCAASAFSAMVPSPSRHLAALVRFDELAHRPGDLGSILQEACRSAAEGVDAGYAGMLQYRVDEQAFVLQAGVGLPSRLVGRARVAAHLGTPAGLAWHVNQPVHFRRFPAGGRIRALEAMTGQRVHRLVSVPVPGEGEAAFGVLEVGSAEAGEFAQRDLLFLQALADCIGAAVGRHADQASCADRAALAAERRRAMRDATRAGHVVVLDAAGRYQGRASGLQQDMQIPAGSE